MTSDDLLTIDQRLVEIISAATISSVSEVIEVMRSIEAELPNEDGLKWFNFLYLRVTESVRDNPPAVGWENPQFLERLAVVFAGLYFGAVVNRQRSSANVPKVWEVLFDARLNQRISRVQFALAGMNAHINRDLAIALLQTAEELGIALRDNSQEHRDFKRVNDILAVVSDQVKQTLATGIIGEIDQDLGRIDDIIAIWSVRNARDAAWIESKLLFASRNIPFFNDTVLAKLDLDFSIVSRALLLPVL